MRVVVPAILVYLLLWSVVAVFVARDAKKQGLSPLSQGASVFILSGFGLALYLAARTNVRRERHAIPDAAEQHLLADMTEEIQRLRREVDYWKGLANAPNRSDNPPLNG